MNMFANAGQVPTSMAETFRIQASQINERANDEIFKRVLEDDTIPTLDVYAIAKRLERVTGKALTSGVWNPPVTQEEQEQALQRIDAHESNYNMMYGRDGDGPSIVENLNLIKDPELRRLQIAFCDPARQPDWQCKSDVWSHVLLKAMDNRRTELEQEKGQA